MKTTELSSPLSAKLSNTILYSVALALLLFTTIALAVTLKDYGYAIDEATYVWVAREERLWFKELPERGLRESLTSKAISDRWHFLEPPRGEATHSNFNLPLAMHSFNVGWLFCHLLFDELTSYRAACVFLFAVCVADSFRTLATRVSLGAGVFSALALLASPRIFGHAHLAATETPLSSLWIMTCLALMRMMDRPRDEPQHGASWRRAVVLATLLSLTMAVKLTGWMLLPAVALWLVSVRPRGWLPAIVLCVVLPPLLIVALTPNLWHAPIHGLRDYLLAASENPWRIATYYLGQGYAGALPTSSGFVLLAVTTPVCLLVLSVLGITGNVASPWLWAIAGPTIGLLAARTAGFVPTHDGERQFLPVLYGVAVLSGIGFDRLADWTVSRLLPLRRGRNLVTATMGVLFLLEPAVDAWNYRGHGLMYYNRAVGGLAGAAECGLEVSYWFEAMSNEDWRKILRDLPHGSGLFLRPDHPGIDDLKGWGVWREDLRSVGPDEADYYLLYAKRAAYLVPDAPSGDLVPTDLGRLAESGPMDQELRFQGVRIVGLWKARP